MRYLPLALLAASLLLSNAPALGQTQLAAASDNAAWIDSVQRLALPQQVAAVQARAWHDTLLAPYQPAICRMPIPAAALRPAPSPEVLAPAEPIGFPLVYVVEGKPFYHNDAGTVGELQRLLTHRPIRQVTCLHGAAATAIYGSRGANGVVILSSKKPKRH